MTSVRPKLKPDTPKTVTAWDTANGHVVWLRSDLSWTKEASELGVFTGTDADAALEQAKTQEGTITDPYFMEVTTDGQVAGRETLREQIRANGPTVPYGVIIK